MSPTVRGEKPYPNPNPCSVCGKNALAGRDGSIFEFRDGRLLCPACAKKWDSEHGGE